jgi:putative membrane protein insertion efficiency factor
MVPPIFVPKGAAHLQDPLRLSEVEPGDLGGEIPDWLLPRVQRYLGVLPDWDAAVDSMSPGRKSSLSGWLIRACRVYRRLRPRSVGDRCAFAPSCSRYAELSIHKYGVWSGVRLSWLRIRRCHAGSGGIDVPPGFHLDPAKLQKALS